MSSPLQSRGLDSHEFGGKGNLVSSSRRSVQHIREKNGGIKRMAIHIADLMQGAMNCITNVGKIKTGENVLISQINPDPDVVDAHEMGVEAVWWRPTVY